MAKSDIWMPIYIGDYLSDTMHLSTEQNGAYLLLLLYGWRNNGLIPSDDESLAQICRLPVEVWKNNRQVISRFFQQGEFWTQKRQLEEIEKAGHRREASKLNGIKGGRPKNNLQVNSRFDSGNLDHNLDHNLEKSSLQLSSSLSLKEELKEEEVPEVSGPVNPLKIISKKKEFEETSNEMKAAKYFWAHVKEWSPSAKEPSPASFQKWAKDFDLIMRIDKRTKDEIKDILAWIDDKKESANGFSWRKVVLSPATLRERWNEGKFSDFMKVQPVKERSIYDIIPNLRIPNENGEYV